jgi:hypothetical protein
MRFKKLVIPLLLFLLAAYVYSQYGFLGKLLRDDAMYIYGGQRFADGVPPYLGIFDFKGPITTMVAGSGVVVSTWLGWDDVHTVRLLFLMISGMAVVAIYMLGESLFQSRRIGVLAALTSLGFFTFARAAASGPRPKTLVVLFGTLSLFLAGRKRWFWAGLFAVLSAFTWQPSGIFVLTTVLVALAQSRSQRMRAISLTCAGIAVPTVVLSAYFLSQNAFSELLDGMVLFHLRYMERPAIPLIVRFSDPFINIFKGYSMMFLPIVIGLGTIIYLYFRRRPLHGTLAGMIAEDTFAPVLVSLPLFVAWSAMDFQGAADFFVFLPYAAVGFGFFLDSAAESMRERLLRDGRKWVPRLVYPAICLALVGSAWLDLHINSEKGYLEQVEIGNELKRRFGEDVRLISIGNPEVLVVLHHANPTPYIVILEGTDKRIQDKTPGGFSEWVNDLEEYDPDVIAVGPTYGPYIGILKRWLNANFDMEKIGESEFYIKKSS